MDHDRATGQWHRLKDTGQRPLPDDSRERLTGGNGFSLFLER